MAGALLLLLGGLDLLVVGAEILVRAAAAVALRLGVSPLLVGITIVAMSTSGPELVIPLRAAAHGDGAIAISTRSPRADRQFPMPVVVGVSVADGGAAGVVQRIRPARPAAI